MNLSLKPTFSLSSSNGEVLVNLNTGEVIDVLLSKDGEDTKRTPEDEPYGIHNIRTVDVKENETYNGRPLENNGIYDILDFGYTLKNGTEVKAEQDWREMVRAMRDGVDITQQH